MPRSALLPSVAISLGLLACAATAATPDTQGIVAHNDVVYRVARAAGLGRTAAGQRHARCPGLAARRADVPAQYAPVRSLRRSPVPRPPADHSGDAQRACGPIASGCLSSTPRWRPTCGRIRASSTPAAGFAADSDVLVIECQRRPHRRDGSLSGDSDAGADRSRRRSRAAGSW